jgi:hypothetical protein
LIQKITIKVIKIFRQQQLQPYKSDKSAVLALFPPILQASGENFSSSSPSGNASEHGLREVPTINRCLATRAQHKHGRMMLRWRHQLANFKSVQLAGQQ